MSICYLGVDDGYFDVSVKKTNIKHKTVLVGVIVCNNIFKDIFLDTITVDGLDATNTIYRMIERATSFHTIASVLLDGVTYAGFNIIDPRKLYRLSCIPIIVIFRHRLDLDKIRIALNKHFPDSSYRYEVIDDVYNKSFEVLLPHLPTIIRIYSIGIDMNRARDIILKLCRVFADPYPLRIADRIASILGRIITKNLRVYRNLATYK